ncbi:hypothetical protein K3N28_07230 [Glycomyces sp. TRM65418]|uniref:hypothetical protein n=1 Tax=Glycomyces sp. TRM65418 TaxID=2867006 RepID=UPI001CE6568B|nr:hypothetical protein [Glycomyces sp. TRM65418]MCC3762863.1 hypothetical protein [Glycomyces sp. TRM65418]QZD56890.1 hypothetical protein K3N28_07180 [Glycomyces sp. TRM65418]
MVYDQNRPDEPQRPSGEDRPARRRIGRSWGPPADEAPEAAEESRQGTGQAPEQYRFDPDRGRRHRYSEDPTGQVPNVPVEIAETGPMVPATRRPSPGDQFEPIPPAPQQSQGPQGFPSEQAQQQSQFAPPGANHEHSAPPGVNQEYSAPPGTNQEYSAPPGTNQEHGAMPGANQQYSPPQQHPGYSAPPMPGDYAAPQQQPNQGPPQPNQEFAPPGGNQDYGVPQQDQNAPAQQFYSAPQQAMPSAPPANQQFAPPGANRERGAAPGANQEYSAPPGANREHGAPPGGNREPVADQQYSAPPAAQREFSAPPAVRPERHAPPADQHHSAPPPPAAPQETPAPPAAPDVNQEHSQGRGPAQPPHTGPIEVPPRPAATPPPNGPGPQAQVSVAEQQTEQFPVQPPPPVTEVSPPAVPSPPVTEQAPLRSSPRNRPPIAEPTPPATVEKDVNDPESARLVEAVRQVPGVRDAFHVTAPDGASSLRLELEDGVDPDEVHAVVSAVVAEQRAVEPGPQSSDEPGEELHGQVESPSTDVEVANIGPVELRRVEIESAGLEAEVSVTLALGDTESTGKVAVPPIDWHIHHAAAAATVEALRPRLGESDVRVEVEHASIVPTGPVKTAVVVILWLDGRSVRRLSGASVVTAERSRAVVSATLGALAGEVSH